MTLHIPPTYFTEDKPLLFLAGPIQGARRWQNEAAQIIEELNSEIVVASPRYIGIDQERVGNWFPHTKEEQVEWETAHLEKAGKNGVILFWLAKESEHTCSRSYGQSTRLELGLWLAAHKMNHAKLVVGIEEGFYGSSSILYRLQHHYPSILVCSSLQATCQKAVELLRT